MTFSFDDFETQSDIAARMLYSPYTIQTFATRKGFPKAEFVIGRTKFYRKSAVKKFFAAKVDRRFREYRNK
jgi:hypothetical protein